MSAVASPIKPASTLALSPSNFKTPVKGQDAKTAPTTSADWAFLENPQTAMVLFPSRDKLPSCWRRFFCCCCPTPAQVEYRDGKAIAQSFRPGWLYDLQAQAKARYGQADLQLKEMLKDAKSVDGVKARDLLQSSDRQLKKLTNGQLVDGVRAWSKTRVDYEAAARQVHRECREDARHLVLVEQAKPVLFSIIDETLGHPKNKELLKAFDGHSQKKADQLGSISSRNQVFARVHELYDDHILKRRVMNPQIAALVLTDLDAIVKKVIKERGLFWPGALQATPPQPTATELRQKWTETARQKIDQFLDEASIDASSRSEVRDRIWARLVDHASKSGQGLSASLIEEVITRVETEMNLSAPLTFHTASMSSSVGH